MRKAGVSNEDVCLEPMVAAMKDRPRVDRILGIGKGAATFSTPTASTLSDWFLQSGLRSCLHRLTRGEGERGARRSGTRPHTTIVIATACRTAINRRVGAHAPICFVALRRVTQAEPEDFRSRDRATGALCSLTLGLRFCVVKRVMRFVSPIDPRVRCAADVLLARIGCRKEPKEIRRAAPRPQSQPPHLEDTDQKR
jgi:hypothetical protein